ncbi:hypothetical protein YC2023_062435 [Brassica napus]
MLNPEQNKYAEAICDAAEKWGFFQVINYGVDLDVLDNVKAATHWFFNLPFEEMSRLTKENSLSTNVREDEASHDKTLLAAENLRRGEGEKQLQLLDILNIRDIQRCSKQKMEESWLEKIKVKVQRIKESKAEES